MNTTTTPSLAETYAGEALGTQWRSGESPHSVGRRLIAEQNVRRGWYNRPPVAYESLPEAPAGNRGDGLSIGWRRFPSMYEVGWPGAHAFDRSGDYLSAAERAMLPCGKPEWVEGVPYLKEDGKSPPAGLWNVRVFYHRSPWDGYDLPAVCPEGDDIWLWTSTLRCALDCGYRILPARGAIFWPEEHPILRTWATRVWAARRALETHDTASEEIERWPLDSVRREAIALVKATYVRTIGMFGNQDMARDIERRDDDDTRSLPRWYRPEWQRTIHAEAVAYAFAVMRRAVGFGRPPLWAHVDTLGFPGDDEPAYIAKGAGLFTGAGKCGAWRYDYTIPMAELLNPRGRDVDKSNGRHRLPAVRVRT